MARSQISLKDWCAKDSLLKAEFLKKESENPKGLVVITSHQGYLPNINIYPHFQSVNFDRGRLINGLSIQVTQSCYEKLKAKFEKENDSIELRGIDYLINIQNRMKETIQKLNINHIFIDASLKIEEIKKKIEDFINV